MPHSSHKKGKAQFKRYEIPGSDGWTHVVRGPPPRSLTLETASDGGGPRSGAPRQGLTLEMVQEHIAKIAKKWKASEMYKAVKNAFEQQLLKADNLRITSCICIGLGTMTAEFIGRADTSLSQLAALESMLELLSRRHTIEQVYVQDPLFNVMDKELLSAKGFIVLEAPNAEECVNPSTFVFAPYIEWVALPSFLGATLAVCNNIQPFLERWDLVQPEHEHVRAVKIFRQFVKERNFQRLPGDLYTMESPTIDGLCIYWKPDAID